ncbi:hypothetical protein [Pseudoxanthomonas sp. Root630]|uniref:hypothetical protein n=1 Tax=Pseudoxanthomonas sp. Root630 TaxID=1736574 RepID=UPI000702A5CB|nr:hypothetical protein [Pseudoxanthomonas sp. Root630]KRA44432.1 hypothetical protein ASD72_10530 [Pseudoxanthomonas sp. Root630]
MVFLALTPGGLQDAISMALPGRDYIWCSASAISTAAFQEHQGIELTRFTETVLFDNEDDVAHAKDVIAEHHPDQRVWIEAAQNRYGSIA